MVCYWSRVNIIFSYSINDAIVEVVDKFKYLEITFSYNSSMKHSVDVFNQQALRA